MTVTSEVVEGLLEAARAAHPREACGLLFGEPDAVTTFRPAANVHPSPETHFEIEPQALVDAHRAMRNGGSRLVGYYHSHPEGPAEPSTTDRAQAPGDGMIWAIVGNDEVALWRDKPAGFEALPYRCV